MKQLCNRKIEILLWLCGRENFSDLREMGPRYQTLLLKKIPKLLRMITKMIFGSKKNQKHNKGGCYFALLILFILFIKYKPSEECTSLQKQHFVTASKLSSSNQIRHPRPRINFVLLHVQKFFLINKNQKETD